MARSPHLYQQHLKGWWSSRGSSLLLLLMCAPVILAGCDGLFSSDPSTKPGGDRNNSSLIGQENARPGTTNWRIPAGDVASTQIQAYADALSVLPGQTLTF